MKMRPTAEIIITLSPEEAKQIRLVLEHVLEQDQVSPAHRGISELYIQQLNGILREPNRI